MAGATTKRRVRRDLVVELTVASLTYLVLSIAGTWNAWTQGWREVTANPFGDASQYEWGLGWVAHAIAHLENPWYSSYLLHPIGINLLANPAPVGISAIAAPLTWAFGPVGSMNLVLTLVPTFSALAMYVAVRRYVGWRPAALVAGALWAFSPYAVYALTSGWLNIATLVVLPLLFIVLDDVLRAQSRRWWVNALAMAGLMVLQFFTSTEATAIYAVMLAAAVLVVVLAAAVRDRSLLRARAPYAAKAIGAGAGITGLLLAYPTWYALRGPSNLGPKVWPLWMFAFSHSPGPALYVSDNSEGPDLGFFSSLGHYLPNTSMFGWALLAIAVLGGLCYWRRGITLLLLVLGAFSLWLARGYNAPGSIWLSIYHWPAVGNVLPERFLGPAWFCLAFLLAVVVDAFRGSLRRWSPSLPGRVIATTLSLTLLVAALWQPVASDLVAMPYPMASPGKATYLSRHVEQLRGHVLLTFPYPGAVASAVVTQAQLGFSYRLAGDFGPSERLLRGEEARADRVISKLNQPPPGTYTPVPGDLRAVAAAMRSWGVTDVVVTPVPGPHDYTHGGKVGQSLVLYTELLGQPEHRDGAWHWSVPEELPRSTWLSSADYGYCAFVVKARGNAISRCVAEHAVPTPS